MAEETLRLFVHVEERERFNLFRFVEEVEQKYCKAPEDIPILVTKEHGKKRYLAQIDPVFFCFLLKTYREGLDKIGTRIEYVESTSGKSSDGALQRSSRWKKKPSKRRIRR